jgi:exonuclease SbcC
MKIIKKLKFKNTLGITELTLEPKQINIIEGRCGAGKTSVLDAINTSLSNKNIRADFVKNGETSATMYVELSDGTIIDRERNLEKSDKIKVLAEGFQGQPETYLKSLFNDNQFRPISFIESSEKEQNKTLLGLVDIEWSKDNIKEWFGEIPDWVDYNQHILNVLGDIQSARGKYYLTREDINRDIKNKKAIASDIMGNLPDNYNANEWRDLKLSELYAEVSKAQEFNNKIEINKSIINGVEDKVGSIQMKYMTIEQNIKDKANADMSQVSIDKENLEKRIKMLQDELAGMANKAKEIKTKALSDIELSNKDRDKEIEVLRAEAKALGGAVAEPIDVAPLEEKATTAEQMKSYLNEYDNAMAIHKEVDVLTAESISLTEKIEKARTLPAELLQKVTSPVEGLSVVDGVPLINGLPIKNLSTGEQLRLAVRIATLMAGDLKVILVDRLESLDAKTQELFIKECIASGMQFIMTKVSDTEYNVVSYD